MALKVCTGPASAGALRHLIGPAWGGQLSDAARPHSCFMKHHNGASEDRARPLKSVKLSKKEPPCAALSGRRRSTACPHGPWLCRKLRACGLGAFYRGALFAGFRTATSADGRTQYSHYLPFCRCVPFLIPHTPFATFTSQDDLRTGTFFVFTCHFRGKSSSLERSFIHPFTLHPFTL